MTGNDDLQGSAPGGGTGAYWAAVAGLVVLVGIVGFALVRRQSPDPARPQAGAEKPAPADPTLIKAEVSALPSPEARIMMERYRCVCGCEDRLSVCTCQNTPGSRDMKAYVEELIDAGKPIRDIDQAMIERYGEQVMYDAAERQE